MIRACNAPWSFVPSSAKPRRHSKTSCIDTICRCSIAAFRVVFAAATLAQSTLRPFQSNPARINKPLLALLFILIQTCIYNLSTGARDLHQAAPPASRHRIFSIPSEECFDEKPQPASPARAARHRTHVQELAYRSAVSDVAEQP